MRLLSSSGQEVGLQMRIYSGIRSCTKVTSHETGCLDEFYKQGSGKIAG